MSSDRDRVLPPPAPLVKMHNYYTLYNQFLTDNESSDQQPEQEMQHDSAVLMTSSSELEMSAASPITSEASSGVSSIRNESALGASEAEALEILGSLSVARETAAAHPSTPTRPDSTTKWEIYPSPEYPVSMKQYRSSTNSKGYMLVYEYTIPIEATFLTLPSSSSSSSKTKQSKKAVSVVQDVVEKYILMMDADSGDINFTPLARAAGHRNITSKMLSVIPGFSPANAQKLGRIKKVKNGPMGLRGTWLKFGDAKVLARTYCESFKEKLVPFFGPEFVRASEEGQASSGSHPTAPAQSAVTSNLIVEKEDDLLPPRGHIPSLSLPKQAPSNPAPRSLLKTGANLLPRLPPPPSPNDFPSTSGPAPSLTASHPVSDHRYVPYPQVRGSLNNLSSNIPTPHSFHPLTKQASTIDLLHPSHSLKIAKLKEQQAISSGTHLPRFSTLLSSLREQAPLKTSAYQLSSTPCSSTFAPGLALPSAGLVSISSGHTVADRSTSSVVVQQCYSPSHISSWIAEGAAPCTSGSRLVSREAIQTPGKQSSIMHRRSKKITGSQLEDIKRILFPYPYEILDKNPTSQANKPRGHRNVEQAN